MKVYILNFSMILVMVLLWPVTSFNQPVAKGETSEKITLFADRSMYIAGEQVNFYAEILTDYELQHGTLSQILYCELITPDGNKVSGSKFLINQSAVQGCIAIPSEQVSGIYFLRAYTKAMRNFGPGAYAYVQLKIINPLRNDVLNAENSENKALLQLSQIAEDNKGDLLNIEINKQIYSWGDSVSLLVKSSLNISKELESFCISVVPETATPLPMISQQTKLQQQTGLLYYPENLGLSLTGKLTAGGGVPLKGKVVNLSVIGAGRDFMAARTDTSGRFFFALPEYSGKRDLFLCAGNTNLPDVKIWVDNDFCSLPVHLPSPVFTLSPEERKVAQNMAMNRQIESHFLSDTVSDTISANQVNRAFYGEPTTVLYIDKYVQLPTLEEYFNELPGQVKVRKRSGEKYFKVIGSYDLSFYDPLVLVDWVAVDEPARVLAVTPQNVARIEIVNQLYVKGGQTYGGIISIISKKGDFAGIDLPSTGIFINFRFLSQNNCSQSFINISSDIPDARNTLMWKPGISLPESGNNSFSFPAPNTPGRYAVVIDGILKNGERFRQTKVFEVNN